MQIESYKNKQKVIVGLGQTGLSCARYLDSQNKKFTVIDSRTAPPGLEEFRKNFPNIKVELGVFKEQTVLEAEELIVSPGVDLRTPVLKQAQQSGVPVTGDVNIFSKKVSSPIVAVTGSNAKSTVVTLLAEMAKNAGIDVALAGNIGKPVLDLLLEKPRSLYVLELSSFQLETTSMLGAKVAAVLNLSPDHMDRYDSVEDYYQAKYKIFEACQQVVVNRDDPLTRLLLPESVKEWSYGLTPGGLNEFGLVINAGETFLAFNKEPLLSTRELKMAGQHNVKNALAALTLGYAAGFEFEPMVATLKEFSGLPHRCQWVAEKAGVNYYNDSKGTNVGACVAAIEGLAEKGRIVLLAGGVGKDADFSQLAEPLGNFGKLAILYGKDANLIARAIEEKIQVIKVSSLEEALQTANEQAQQGDVVLLSPACASFDMYQNFEQRGEAFIHAVRTLH
ncbi:UDP-N-acetylmuramoyl-L-alanine--D-glutamate ligase [Gammaproteobacteria bacterium]|nr:UDP-N-acetylmuramoyl-L-alanine--D-glutamate ligase [Gammaproteobacteria bacterium]